MTDNAEALELVQGGLCPGCRSGLYWEALATHDARTLRCSGPCLNSAVVTGRELRNVRHEINAGREAIAEIVWRRWNGEEPNPL